MDFSADPRVSVIVAQYIWGGQPDKRGGEMGGMKGLDYKYGDNKPIELNETSWYPWGYRGDKIADSRVEGWEFIVGGGAGFNHLNGLFTPEDPAGKPPENDQLLSALGSLKRFMDSFEFVKMSPDKAFVVSGLEPRAYCRVLSEPGKQYALYIHHSGPRDRGSYEVMPGNYQEELVLRLPPGNYLAEWINPATGNLISSQEIQQTGDALQLATPKYSIDVALRLKHK
jgi:hypothetical protein